MAPKSWPIRWEFFQDGFQLPVERLVTGWEVSLLVTAEGALLIDFERSVIFFHFHKSKTFLRFGLSDGDVGHSGDSVRDSARSRLHSTQI